MKDEEMRPEPTKELYQKSEDVAEQMRKRRI